MNEEKIKNPVYCTRDYSIFKFSSLNRQVNEQHIKELVAAIKKNNQLDANPILVNSDFEIVSGQHRFLAAKKLNLPVYYIQKDSEDIPDIYFLTSNMNQRESKLIDSINFYSMNKEIPDYIYFKKTIELLKISPGAVSSLIGNIHGCKTYAHAIRSGSFKLAMSQKETDDLVKKYYDLKEVLKYLPFSVKCIYSTSKFCQAFADFYRIPEIDWRIFETRIRTNWKMLDINLYGSAAWYQRFIEVYNRKAKSNKYTPNEGANRGLELWNEE